MAGAIEADFLDKEARYTSPPKMLNFAPKKVRYDLSLERAECVSGCSATLPRGDSLPVRQARGHGPGASRGSFRPFPSRGGTSRGASYGPRGSYSRAGRRDHNPAAVPVREGNLVSNYLLIILYRSNAYFAALTNLNVLPMCIQVVKSVLNTF
jgi:hypothetical protein